MPSERYTILVSDEPFRFTRDQLESEPGNYFATYFFGEFQEAASGTKELVLEKEPMLFKLIQNHIRGYKIFPIADDFLPPYTDATTALQNLLSDVEFFGFGRLSTLVKDEIRRRTIKPPNEAMGEAGQVRYRIWSHKVLDATDESRSHTNISKEGVQYLLAKNRLHFDCTKCLKIAGGWNFGSEGRKGRRFQLRNLLAILMHASHVMKKGRHHLQALSEGHIVTTRGEQSLSSSLTERVRADLLWWLKVLKNGGDTCSIAILATRIVSHEIDTDAGIAQGRASGTEWRSGELGDKQEPGSDWAEAAAIKTAVTHLVSQPGSRGSHFIIKCSQHSLVHDWTMGSCSDGDVDDLLLAILHVLVQNGCWLSLERVAEYQGQPSMPSSPEPLKILAPTPLLLIPPPPSTMPEIVEGPSPKSARFSFLNLDYEWNLVNKTASLTKGEREGCLQAVEQSLTSVCKHKIVKIQLRRVLVRLLHAGHVVPDGRLHLQSLSEALLDESQGGQHLPDDLEERVKTDLLWWQDLLQRCGDTTSMVRLEDGVVDTKVYTDASPIHGCAVVVDGKWKNWRWREDITRNNTWAEAIAIELAVRHLVAQPKSKGSHFRINCDNMGVITCWRMGGSSNSEINRVIISILHVLVQNDCWLSLDWICGHENPADKPSRLKLPSGQEMIQNWDSNVIPLEIQLHFRDVDL